jgi:hypothetical protein
MVGDDHHLPDGDPLGDAHDEVATGGFGLEDGVGCEPGRDEDEARGCLRLLDGLRDRVEDRDAVVQGLLSALAGRDTCDHIRAVSEVASGVERALSSRYALNDDLRGLIEQDGHEGRAYRA